jgi:hypothetical protein
VKWYKADDATMLRQGLLSGHEGIEELVDLISHRGRGSKNSLERYACP